MGGPRIWGPLCGRGSIVERLLAKEKVVGERFPYPQL